LTKTRVIWDKASRASLDDLAPDVDAGTVNEIVDAKLVELGEGFSYLRLCPQDALREMEQSLKRHGQLTPIVAWHDLEAFDVIDGLKRLRAARALGWETLRTQVWAGEITQAKLMVWQCNQARGVSELEEGWLVRALYREDHLPQQHIAHLLGRHKSWVSRRLMLVEGLTDAVQADIRLGLLNATAAREVGRLPRGNQDTIAQMVCQRGMTTRQTANLVDALLLAGDEQSQQEVIQQVLEGDETMERPSRRERTPAEWLLADIEAVGRLSARLRSRLMGHPLRSLGPGIADIANRELEALLPSLGALRHTIKHVLATKEPRHAHPAES
jgi:ParB/RepB/Spo0J family partition protein